MRHGMMGVAEPEEPITGYDDLGDIHPGDLQQGSGVSTSQLGRVTVSPFEGDRGRRSDVHDIASSGTFENIVRTVTGKRNSGISLLALGIVLVLLFVIKYVSEKAGEEREFATMRIGLENITINTLSVLVGLYLLTIGLSLWPTHGPIVTAFREFVSVAK